MARPQRGALPILPTPSLAGDVAWAGSDNPPAVLQTFGNAHAVAQTTVAASATINAGSLILVVWAGSTLASLKSALGNAVGDPHVIGGPASNAVWLFRATQGGAETLTVTGASSENSLSCAEIGNWSQIDPASVFGVNGGSSAAINSGATGVPQSKSSLVVGFASVFAAAVRTISLPVMTPALASITGYAQGNGNFAPTYIAYGVLTADQAETFSATLSVADFWDAGCIIIRGDDATPALASHRHARDLVMPRCSMLRLTAYNTVAGVFTGVPFDTLQDGPSSIAKATGVAGTAGFLVPYTGRYLLMGRYGFVAQAIGDIAQVIAINTTSSFSYRGNYGHEYSATGLDVSSIVAVTIQAHAGDFLQIQYWASAIRALQLAASAPPWEQWAILEYLGP